MKLLIALAGLLLGGAQLASAQAAPANAPAGTTGICKDGSFTSTTTKSGACRGHNGVQTWYAAPGGKPAAAPAAPVPGAAGPPVAANKPASPAPASSAPSKAGPAAAANAKTAAPGGAPNLVWVNTDSKVYHCYGTTYYGKTKTGKYMTEADAKAMGAHGDHGAACSK